MLIGQCGDMASDDELTGAEAARRALLAAGAADLPRPPWQHPAALPEDTTLLRFALWRANQEQTDASRAELTAGLALIDSARSELDTLETALLLTARAEGLTWAQIADQLSLRSPQAAQQRFQRISQRPHTAPAESEDS